MKLELSTGFNTKQGQYPFCVLAAFFSLNGLVGSSMTFAADNVLNTRSLAIEEVVVTSEKINKSLKETTTAITVINGSDGQSQSVYDLVDIVPNVVANPFGVPNVRGAEGTGTAIGSYSFFSGARPRVSTTVDGIADVWSGYVFGEAGLWDVEQVEFLRGPQSTTQGRNTIGGAIVITTNDPSFDWEGDVRTGYEDNGDKYQLAGVVSGPIVDDQLAFRLAVDGYEGSSFIDYVSSGGSSFPWDPGETKDTNIRGKLLWKPQGSDDLAVKLTVVDRQQEGEYANYVTGPDFFDYKFVTGRLNARYQQTQTTAVSVDVDYSINDAMSAYFLVGYSDYHSEFEEYPGTTTLDTNEESYTAEARFIYAPADDSVSGVVGLYYFTRDNDLLVGPNLYSALDDIETMALFTDASVQLSDKLYLDVGGRVEKENQKRDVDVTRADTRYDFEVGKTMYLPKIGLRYEVHEDMVVGVSARQGYNPGGGGFSFYSRQSYEFDRETVDALELSLRSNFLENRLQLNSNIFFNEYTDYQAVAKGPSGDPRDNLIYNIPQAQTYGLEVELIGQVSEALRVNTSLGLLDTEISSTNSANTLLEGNELSNAPALNAALGFDYSFVSGVFVGAKVHYVGEYFSDIENDKAEEAGDYYTVGLNLGYETDQYSIRAYAKNLTDEEVLLRVSSFAAQVGQPRSLGVVVDYHF